MSIEDMMTPEEEQRLLDEVARSVDRSAAAGYESIRDAIRRGEPAREAVGATFAAFSGEYSAIVSGALGRILRDSIGRSSDFELRVAGVTLSERLYKQAGVVGDTVAGIVERHARGFQDARALTLELFEGYGFRPSGAEPLQISRRNPVLPQYLRDLLADPDVADELGTLLARVQANERKTEALRAGYLDLLRAIEEGAGRDALEKKIAIAYDEKVRYFASRIAQTELHRAYAERQAEELMNDSGVEAVQWQINPSHPRLDICDYFAGADLYGLGRGVYPVGRAPVAPAHPHCRCYLKPRTDLRLGTIARARFRPNGGRDYVLGHGMAGGAAMMGSRERLAQVAQGADPLDVWNAYREPEHAIRTVEEVAAQRAAGVR